MKGASRRPVGLPVARQCCLRGRSARRAVLERFEAMPHVTPTWAVMTSMKVFSCLSRRHSGRAASRAGSCKGWRCQPPHRTSRLGPVSPPVAHSAPLSLAITSSCSAWVVQKVQVHRTVPQRAGRWPLDHGVPVWLQGPPELFHPVFFGLPFPRFTFAPTALAALEVFAGPLPPAR